jgi:VCBS repeat-containing protein
LSFDFTVQSTGGAIVQTDSSSATININGYNAAPVTVDSSFTVSEANAQGLASTLTGNLLDGATDAEGDAISVFSTTIGAIGETVTIEVGPGRFADLTIQADGSFTLTSLDDTLDLNASDLVEIGFTAVSSGGTTPQFSSSVASISIEGVNVAPDAGDVSVDVFEQNTQGLDSTVEGNLLANSTDADGDTMYISSTSLGVIGETVEVVTTGGRTGLLTIGADGSYSFTSTSPDLDVNQTDTVTFEFTVSSTGGTTVQNAPAIATINIAGVNVAPTAVDQFYTTTEDEVLRGSDGNPVNVLLGASDPDGDSVTLQSVSDGIVISTSRSTVDNPIVKNGVIIGYLNVFVDGSF